MYKGTTPTFTLTLPEEIDLAYASNVYVTFSHGEGSSKLTKTGEDLVIDRNVIDVFLTQAETLAFAGSAVFLQVNWTYQEGDVTKRAASEVVVLRLKENLEAGVLE